MPFESFSEAFVSLALILPRIAAACLLLPYFTAEIVPPIVRNVFFVSLALAVMPLALTTPVPPAMQGTALIPVVLKEIFVGVSLGFSFSIVFWALEGAGQVIDAKISTSTVQLSDPLTGQQTTLIGAYMSRLAAYLFAAFGGLRLFIDLVLSSFTVWPVQEPLPDLAAVGARFFIERFADLMALILLLAAPALCVLTLLEFGLGLVNRYAPQLNVFTLSLALKAWIAILVLLLTVATVGSFTLDWLAGQRGLLQLLPF
jgi:type III secretion protein T